MRFLKNKVARQSELISKQAVEIESLQAKTEWQKRRIEIVQSKLKSQLCDCESVFRGSTNPREHQVHCAYKEAMSEIDVELSDGMILLGAMV